MDIKKIEVLMEHPCRPDYLEYLQEKRQELLEGMIAVWGEDIFEKKYTWLDLIKAKIIIVDSLIWGIWSMKENFDRERAYIEARRATTGLE